MRFFQDQYNEETRQWERKEITKEEARNVLQGFYNNIDDCLQAPCYYRTFWGGVEVIENEAVKD